MPFPPPPARVEFVPARPHADAVWIDGEWSWRGRRWAWTFGRWVVVPEQASFARSTTRRRRDGSLTYASGTFRDPEGREVTSPRTLAVGRAQEEDVVDEEGDLERTGPNTVPPPPAAR